MSWSTREIADLAGISLRTVRHYHDVGLLDEPERRANGYKKYGVVHLVKVLRIKRLTDLGFSLSRIADMEDTGYPTAEDLRTHDTELAATIERLQRVRHEVGLLLTGSGSGSDPTQPPAAPPAEAPPAGCQSRTAKARPFAHRRPLPGPGLSRSAGPGRQAAGDPA
ncbi:MerR family transcriptional regulator [Nocardiopsis sediminis]|uniref:MerR family transcriptional regulator n=1 Tax=Nocardiopsis sediminis TaxID=1778267 RepID=A0ABV8FJX0_9ACTN